MKYIKILVVTICVLLSACKQAEPLVIEADELHHSIDHVIKVMIHDIFSPPVASRIFAYPNIAAYEIVALNNSKYTSLVGQLKGLTPIPASETPVNYQLAALISHIELSKQLVFSEEKIEIYRDSLYISWKKKNRNEFLNAETYGLQVADHISQWMDGDNYKQTRTMSKFHVISEDEGRWQPTPPSYMDGLEPHWNKIRPFVIDSAAQFKPTPPPVFSMEEGSDFYKELQEVYDISNRITAEGDASEEVQVAQFWDCNPYVSVTRGHLMFATKKITPGAHWIGITKIACKKSESNFDDSVFTYAKTSLAIADAFISCWDEKYRSNLVRPETLINTYFNDNWKPILQTPPFPEYSSGHSVVSGAASIALNSIFGNEFSFDDTSELAYGLPMRHFESFDAAADEAAISRMYGGIHYRSAVEIGIQQGRSLGDYVVANLNMKSK